MKKLAKNTLILSTVITSILPTPSHANDGEYIKITTEPNQSDAEVVEVSALNNSSICSLEGLSIITLIRSTCLVTSGKKLFNSKAFLFSIISIVVKLNHQTAVNFDNLTGYIISIHC